MNTNTVTNRKYWPIVLLLATGVLSGCHYCEPLLIASLVSGGFYRLLRTEPFRNTAHKPLTH